MITFAEAFRACPLIAILRGVKPSEVLAIAEVLYAAGFRLIEVPTNSPDPFDSIALLQAHMGERCLIGAGTVVESSHIDALLKTQAKLMIAPNVDVKLIQHAKALKLTVIPGFMTPTEAYAAIHAGADALKIFPCNLLNAETLKAMKSILPKDMPILPVGGIHPLNLKEFIAAGAAGFGLGSALYKPGDTPQQVSQKAREFIAALQ